MAAAAWPGEHSSSAEQTSVVPKPQLQDLCAPFMSDKDTWEWGNLSPLGARDWIECEGWGNGRMD